MVCLTGPHSKDGQHELIFRFYVFIKNVYKKAVSCSADQKPFHLKNKTVIELGYSVRVGEHCVCSFLGVYRFQKILRQIVRANRERQIWKRPGLIRTKDLQSNAPCYMFKKRPLHVGYSIKGSLPFGITKIVVLHVWFSAVDECKVPSICPKNLKCVNLPISFTCECRDGYRPRAGNSTDCLGESKFTL